MWSRVNGEFELVKPSSQLELRALSITLVTRELKQFFSCLTIGLLIEKVVVVGPVGGHLARILGSFLEPKIL